VREITESTLCHMFLKACRISIDVIATHGWKSGRFVKNAVDVPWWVLLIVGGVSMNKFKTVFEE